MTTKHIAVLGAGISGTIAARTLRDRGFDVTLFDKSRGLGGRMATRRGDPGISFDHGAQYFTARDPHFQRYVQSWIEQGIVAEWTGAIAEIDASEPTPPQARAKIDQPQRFVAVPGMTAIARHLAADLPLQLDTRIARATCDGGACVGGKAKSCSDDNPCTTDSCNVVGGACAHTATDAACNDGNACTSNDACGGGACAGKPVNCDDGNGCTADSCDAKTGCGHAANTEPCDADGSLCTSGDTCAAGSCKAGPPLG